MSKPMKNKGINRRQPRLLDYLPQDWQRLLPIVLDSPDVSGCALTPVVKDIHKTQPIHDNKPNGRRRKRVHALRQRQLEARSKSHSTPSTFRPVLESAVIHAFLKNEQYKHQCAYEIQHQLGIHYDVCLNAPDFSCAWQNHLRKRALNSFRRQLWNEIPSDTRWFQLSFIPDRNWSQRLVALWPVATIVPNANPVNLNNLIVWTPGKLDDPSSIWYVLEGNHRITQWKANGCPSLPASLAPITIYGGESTSICCWIFRVHNPLVCSLLRKAFLNADSLVNVCLEFLQVGSHPMPPPLIEYHTYGYAEYLRLAASDAQRCHKVAPPVYDATVTSTLCPSDVSQLDVVDNSKSFMLDKKHSHENNDPSKTIRFSTACKVKSRKSRLPNQLAATTTTIVCSTSRDRLIAIGCNAVDVVLFLLIVVAAWSKYYNF